MLKGKDKSNFSEVHFFRSFFLFYSAADTWFENLNQETKDDMVSFLTQAVSKYADQARTDLKTKFHIDDDKVEKLYQFAYQNPVSVSSDIVHGNILWLKKKFVFC